MSLQDKTILNTTQPAPFVINWVNDFNNRWDNASFGKAWDDLTSELESFCNLQGLPYESADELHSRLCSFDKECYTERSFFLTDEDKNIALFEVLDEMPLHDAKELMVMNGINDRDNLGKVDVRHYVYNSMYVCFFEGIYFLQYENQDHTTEALDEMLSFIDNNIAVGDEEVNVSFGDVQARSIELEMDLTRHQINDVLFSIASQKLASGEDNVPQHLIDGFISDAYNSTE